MSTEYMAGISQPHQYLDALMLCGVGGVCYTTQQERYVAVRGWDVKYHLVGLTTSMYVCMHQCRCWR